MAIGGLRLLFRQGSSLRLGNAAPALVLLLLTPHLVAATFTGDYDPSHWTLVNTSADGTASFGSGGATLTLVGGNTGTGLSGTTDFFILAPVSGAFQFQYAYSSTDVPGFDFAGYLLDGGFFQLADTNGQHGSVSVAVTAGERFGFRVGAADNEGEPGILTVSDFNPPTAAPEPSSQLLVLLAPALILVSRVQRRQHPSGAKIVRAAVVPPLTGRRSTGAFPRHQRSKE